MPRAFPAPRIMSQADVFRHLGRSVADDVMDAGWLKPRICREGLRGKAKRIFALEDVLAVEDRILAGDYPTLNTSTRHGKPTDARG